MQKNLNIAFIGGLIGVFFMSLYAPAFINLLFTPPVDFGMSCSPAGAWSMHKLLTCQVVGLVLGVVIIFWLRQKFFSGKKA